MFNWLEEGGNKICQQCSKYPCFCYDNLGKCTKCYFYINNCECKGEQKEVNWNAGVCKKCKQGVLNCKCENDENQMQNSTSSNTNVSEAKLINDKSNNASLNNTKANLSVNPQNSENKSNEK